MKDGRLDSEGCCEVLKRFDKLTPPGSKTRTAAVQISISYAEHGTIIGEECFLGSEKYEYTVTVKSSEVRLLELPKICLRELVQNEMLEDLRHWYQKSRYVQLT